MRVFGVHLHENGVISDIPPTKYYTMDLGIGAKIEHPDFGEGVIFGSEQDRFRIYFQEHGEKQLAKTYAGFEVLEPAEEPEDFSISMEDVVAAVENVFDRYMDDTSVVEMGDKWDGGTLILKPGSEGLATKELPIETFFHKIVMVRDRLRVLEQNINSHKVLTDEEKVNLQQYITRIYGSLTTFNVLFASKNDHFVGERSKG